jgi:glucose-1-phosphate cytidylyltransferase
MEAKIRSRRCDLWENTARRLSFVHIISVDEEGVVKSIDQIAKSGARINGGFFVFRREIFRHINEGDELVEQPFHRLISKGELVAHAHNGFWACMDTFKEMQELEDVYSRGNAPWAVWNGQKQSKRDSMPLRDI